MASGQAVWGLELGQCALKAIKLRAADDGQVELLAFDIIEHPKILSQPDADVEQLTSAALEKFVSRNDWQGDAFVVGVPGQQTFARFCKLPPVEPKKIPDIVKFEAGQQIPFDMDDVVWDYEVFQAEDSPDVEVGIFAMRKDLIRKHLDHLGAVGINPFAIQTIPSALYNFCRFDAQGVIGDNVATVIVDVGAQNTDLVIVEPNSAWTRNIPLGGNSFTEALVKSFKLSYAKAENLKRGAASSKYARQIFQAMRPVFADLVAEIQRSLGFYASTHRDIELKAVLACGNAFRLPGLQKYLENNLTIGDVTRLEKFNKVVAGATGNAPNFTDNIMSFASAYGLAVQGLGKAKISASLLPPELARGALWRRKQPAFLAAAACLGIASLLPWVRVSMDSSALAANRDSGAAAKRVVDNAESLQRKFSEVSSEAEAKQAEIVKFFELQENRALIPRILAFVHDTLPEVDERLAAAQSPEELQELIKSNPGRYERSNRWQMKLDVVNVTYAADIDQLDRPQVRRSDLAGSRAGRSVGPVGPMSGRTVGPLGEGPRGASPYGEGRAATEANPEESASSPGFYIGIAGRLLGGKVPSDAYNFFAERFNKRVLELGSQPGRGFYVPAEDPKSNDPRERRNLALPTVLVPLANSQQAVQGRPLTRFAAQSEAPKDSESEIPPEFRDPVTGEDIRTDWEFELGFKIKLGEPPAKEGEAAPPPEDG